MLQKLSKEVNVQSSGKAAAGAGGAGQSSRSIGLMWLLSTGWASGSFASWIASCVFTGLYGSVRISDLNENSDLLPPESNHQSIKSTLLQKETEKQIKHNYGKFQQIIQWLAWWR